MKETKLIFAHPGDSYFEYSDKLIAVASLYSFMAITEFDNLFKFKPEYEPFKTIPDYEQVIGEKEEVSIIQSIFYNQPIEELEFNHIDLLSSSYLQNPDIDFMKFYSHLAAEIHFNDLYAPDYEVVEFTGSKENVNRGIKILEEFYKKYDWETFSFDGELDKQTILLKDNPRFDSIQIYNSSDLEQIAKEELGYDSKNLYFKNQR